MFFNFFSGIALVIFDFYEEADVSVTLPSFLQKNFKNRSPKKLLNATATGSSIDANSYRLQWPGFLRQEGFEVNSLK